MIQPTPGRVVWYYPSAQDLDPTPRGGEFSMTQMLNGDPLMAHVVGVHTDRCVNLLVIDAEGFGFPRESVQLVQGDDKDVMLTDDRPHCTWMPYQKQQAMKHDLTQGLLGAAAAVADTAAAALGAEPARPAYQQRVITEMMELGAKLNALGDFICTSTFGMLPADEQGRLRRQHRAMIEYLTVLNERIEAFK